MIDDDAKTIIRTLRDELVEARPFVFGYTHVNAVGELDWRSVNALAILERVDGAIAEAEEVLT